MDIFSVILILKIITVIIFAGGLMVLFFIGWSMCTILVSGVPWARIPSSNLDKIFQAINLPKNAWLYDLGCGDGRVLFAADKLGLRAVGYELSLYPFLKARFKKFINRGQVRLRRQNFFKQDLSQADAVFVFLVDKVMAKVGQKLQADLKPGTPVISYGFTIPDWPIEKTVATKPSPTYVYKVK